MTDFSLGQIGISISASIDVVGDANNLPEDYVRGAKGFIVLRNPRGIYKRLEADSMFIESSRFVVLGYDDTAQGRSTLQRRPIFDVAGQWDKGAEVVWPDGRTISVPLDSTSIIDVS